MRRCCSRWLLACPLLRAGDRWLAVRVRSAQTTLTCAASPLTPLRRSLTRPGVSPALYNAGVSASVENQKIETQATTPCRVITDLDSMTDTTAAQSNEHFDVLIVGAGISGVGG